MEVDLKYLYLTYYDNKIKLVRAIKETHILNSGQYELLYLPLKTKDFSDSANLHDIVRYGVLGYKKNLK